LSSADPKTDLPADPERLRGERASRRTEPLRVREQPEWRRLARAVRRQIAACVELDADAAEIERLAREAESLADALERTAPGKRVALVESSWGDDGGTMAYLPFSPVMGALNPASFGIEIRQVGDKVVTEIRLAEPAEGATGLVHGGVIAGIYDELLAAANLMIKSGGPTGTLTVRYRRPTPLYALLRFEGWIVATDEKKVHAKGHCLVGGRVVSEGEAVFVKFSPDRQPEGWRPPDTGRG